MRRRRIRKVQRIPSDELESQGEGTWVEVRKKLTFQHLRPVIELAAWREDPRIKNQQDQAGMVEAMGELLDSFGVALWPLVQGWNWVTDMEAELSVAPRVDGSDIHLLLATPIWAGSDYFTVENGQSTPPDIVGLPIYLGEYPSDYQSLVAREVSDDGRVLVCNGELTREYAPDEHYALIGLPAPDGPDAFAWLGLEEMMWLIGVFSQQFQAETKRREGRNSPKAVD